MALIATGLTTHIMNNQLRSGVLLLGFPVLLAGMLWAFFVGLAATAQPYGMPYDWTVITDTAFDHMLHYVHWVILAAGIWFAIAFVFHGSMMRAATGARPVTRAEMPKIYNMLENLCIAEGMTMPSFEVIESSALNAYASGISDSTYKIVLTRGIIDALEDDELEGVIAHELSHIKHRDVRLLIIAVIFVGMIGFLSEMAFRSMRFGSMGTRDRKGGGVIILIALVVLLVGWVFSTLIRFALSRRREFMADAGAVEMTKNPDAMMRALMRISGKDRIRDMPDDVQMMCIENSHRFMGMFATHPPIEKRVAIISQMTGTPMPEALAPKRTSQGAGPWGGKS